MTWFDLDNSPHVPLFRPIFAEMDARNRNYIVTARHFAQTKDLLEFWKIDHTMVGVHGGANKIRKIANVLSRAYALRKVMSGKDTLLAVNHGSRSQVIAAASMGIRSLVMLDYEHTESRIFNALATMILMPSYIPESILRGTGFNLKKIIRYQGFKEEIYLKDFRSQIGFRKTLGVPENTILITLRPPSVTGNYHDQRSEALFRRCLEYFSKHDNTHCLIANRTSTELRILPVDILKRENVSILKFPVDGLQLLWHSDIVVSGGGTMNREAALMSVPTFSIFTGHKPFLDLYLQQQGKLSFIANEREIESISISKRSHDSQYVPANIQLAGQITDLFIALEGRRPQ